MKRGHPGKGPDPYLTVVATSRNDDHGGNLLRRMQLFVNGFFAQCERHQLNAELVLVEWNPPSNRPRLVEALHWPTGPHSMRIIEVPPEIHRQFRHSERLPLFQMIGKNVGIRRALGQFVLATNVDILFSDELVSFLASRRLRKGRIYRAPRYDVPENIPLNISIDKQLDFCRKNAFRVYLRDGILNLKTGQSYRAHSHMSFVRRRLGRLLAELLPSSMKRSLHFRLRAGMARLHTNACGDFTLMAREDWFRLRGYPQLEMYSLHLDSLLCYMACSAGIREVVMRYPVYHIEHSGGWTPEVERDEGLRKGLSKAEIPQLTSRQLGALAVKMFCERTPTILNLENWGLADRYLPETRLH